MVAESVEKDLESLMVRYQSGDIDAFDGLYHELSPPLARYLLSLARNPTISDELVQETFLQIHRSRHTYQRGRSVRSWAFGVARYVFLMNRRSRRSREDQESQADVFALDLPMPSWMDSWLDRDQLGQLVGKLKPSYREALLLHHVWGFSFKEIGRILGIRETTAKVRAHRGMEQLRSEAGAGGQQVEELASGS